LIDKYDLYYQFIDVFGPSGFTKIDRLHPVLQNIEEMTTANGQFFFVGDILRMKILFTSRRSVEMMGIKPENIDPAVFFTSTHPDDLFRHNIARTKLLNLGQQLYIDRKKSMILSSNFRFKNPLNGYTNTLVQCYLFFSEIPCKTVFLIQVMTDISKFQKIKNGYHYYIGDDLLNFRYPDDKLLGEGCVFSKMEFNILKLLAEGLSSEQIANKLFLSIHTVNSHRRNILKRSGQSSTNIVISDLKDRGIL
jgi:hypothetical protein